MCYHSIMRDYTSYLQPVVVREWRRYRLGFTSSLTTTMVKMTKMSAIVVIWTMSVRFVWIPANSPSYCRVFIRSASTVSCGCLMKLAVSLYARFVVRSMSCRNQDVRATKQLQLERSWVREISGGSARCRLA